MKTICVFGCTLALPFLVMAQAPGPAAVTVTLAGQSMIRSARIAGARRRRAGRLHPGAAGRPVKALRDDGDDRGRGRPCAVEVAMGVSGHGGACARPRLRADVRLRQRQSGRAILRRRPAVFRRQAVGSLSWEGIGILPDGTMYFGDELRPGGRVPGGAIYKSVPDSPYGGGYRITMASLSPFASGRLYGLQVGSTGDNGQGTEIGQGVWVSIDTVPYLDASGNVILRNAQGALHFTGYYRPEDMDRDPLAADAGQVRMCWTNTGRMSNGGGSVRVAVPARRRRPGRPERWLHSDHVAQGHRLGADRLDLHRLRRGGIRQPAASSDQPGSAPED
jgi:hypothetical protein